MPTAKDEQRQLYNLISSDINRRRDWRTDLEKLAKIRLSKKKDRLPYPGAPNWVDPIVDDNVNSIGAQLFSIIKQPINYAIFEPLNVEAHQWRTFAELAFQTLLNLVIDFDSVVEVLIDQYLESGIAFSKVIIDDNAWLRNFGEQRSIPAITSVHPFDIVVPETTKYDVLNAERVAHILRFSYAETLETARINGWNMKNVKKALRLFFGPDDTAEFGSHETDQTGDDQTGYQAIELYNRSSRRLGLFIVWEVYRQASDGTREVVIFNPDFPDLVFDRFPWTWNDGSRKEWPFSSHRFENRKPELYDVRGLAYMLKDFQAAASQFKNVKGTAYDFFGYPMYRAAGDGLNRATRFRPGPGKQMPDGIELIPMPAIQQHFTFDQQQERSQAALRAGSTQAAFSSQLGKKEKTATEANIQNLNSQRLSLSSVMRFTRPFKHLFTMMWRMLGEENFPLPIISEEQQTFTDIATLGQQKGVDIYSMPFLITSSVNSRNYDPVFKLSQLAQLQP